MAYTRMEVGSMKQLSQTSGAIRVRLHRFRKAHNIEVPANCRAGVDSPYRSKEELASARRKYYKQRRLPIDEVVKLPK